MCFEASLAGLESRLAVQRLSRKHVLTQLPHKHHQLTRRCVQVGHNSVELAMEWLFSHPEDPSTLAAPAPAAAEPAKDVAQQLKLAPAQVALCPHTTRPHCFFMLLSSSPSPTQRC